MAIITEQNKVLIIGAGPGGLALAQILRKNGIPFEIFERDDETHVRSQGWAVALVECLPHLAELLPKDIGDLASTSVNSGTEGIDSLAVADAETGECLNQLGGVSQGQPGYVLRVSRERLRNLLMDKITISGGKRFERYVENSNSVTAYFKDGTSATGALLIGADGAHSHVRAQLAGGGKPVLSRYIPVVGECELPRHQYEPIRELSTAAILAARPGLRYLIGQLSIKPDLSSAKFYYAVCYMADRPEEESARVAVASKEELYQTALEKTKGMAPVLTDLIHHTGVEGMMTPPIKFSEYVSPESLPRGRVTLIGDAAHAMIPFRGQGANTALKDACDLARLLIKRSKSSRNIEVSQTVDEYNSIMLPRGREMVLSSRAAGDIGSEGLEGLTKGRLITSKA